MNITTIARVLWRGRPLRHAPIAVDASADPVVQVTLLTKEGRRVISGWDAPVSLVPFRIGVLAARSAANQWTAEGLWEVRTTHSNQLVGAMKVRQTSSLSLAGSRLEIYTAHSPRNYAATAVARATAYALAQWYEWRRPPVQGLRMSAADLRSLDIYYLRPRPTFLVTASHGDGFNLFPMDLIGFVGTEGLFLLALRTTSPSIAHMKRERRVAVSTVGHEMKELIYELGKHHKAAYTGDAPLPLDTQPSSRFGLPVPAAATRVLELTIVDHAEIGSHTVFAAEVARETRHHSVEQLGHVSGLFATSKLGRSCALREV